MSAGCINEQLLTHLLHQLYRVKISMLCSVQLTDSLLCPQWFDTTRDIKMESCPVIHSLAKSLIQLTHFCHLTYHHITQSYYSAQLEHNMSCLASESCLEKRKYYWIELITNDKMCSFIHQTTSCTKTLWCVFAADSNHTIQTPTGGPAFTHREQRVN